MDSIMRLPLVASLLILGMMWSLTNSGWIAAATVASYWLLIWLAWKLPVWRGKIHG